MNFDVERLGGAEYPRRRPWALIIVVVLVLALIVLVRSCGRRGGEDEGDTVPPTGADVVPRRTQDVARTSLPGDLPPAIISGSDQEALEKGISLENANDLLGARRLYRSLANGSDDPSVRLTAEARLGAVNVTLMMNPFPMPEKVEYEVKPGDSVDRIARRFGTTKELVALSNNIKDPDRIKAGDSLRVFKGKLALSIDKKRHEMTVTMDGSFFKRYRVGTGAFDKTPAGKFIVTEKEIEPIWWQRDGEAIPFGDKRNILGTRWLAIKDSVNPAQDKRGLGIHGTADNSSIGKSLSAGCIRLVNDDVEELYVYAPIGTHVEITD